MLDPIAKPQAAVLFLLQRKKVAEVASELTSDDRSRVRAWKRGDVPTGRSKARQIARYASKVCLDECGMPLISWKLGEERYLTHIRQIDQLNEDSLPSAYLELYHNPGVHRFATLDVSETPGLMCEDTVRVALLNLIGMHVAWRVAQSHSNSNRLNPRFLVQIALRRATVACDLLHYARTEQAQSDSRWTPKELIVFWLYARQNQLAVLSLFRKSLSKFRGGFWVFDDQAAWAYVDDALVQQFSEIFPDYRKGHPDRMTVASNTLVAASIRKNKAIANKAWLAMIDENTIAADLSQPLPSHERPLSNSPDLRWLEGVNGGWIYNPMTFTEEQS